MEDFTLCLRQSSGVWVGPCLVRTPAKERKVAPRSEMQLIFNDIPQIGSSLHCRKLLQIFWEKTSALNEE